jgi:ABC-type uncharacterized transport system substrate-binding protein
VSYGTNYPAAYAQVGEYLARVLNGEQPENLPAPDQAADGCHRSVNSLPIEAISSPLAP